MTINQKQRTVLLVCAAAVGGMLLYPPVHFRGYGQGYSWLFTMRAGLTINTAQLVTQWVGLCLIGAIAFVLAGASAQAAAPEQTGLGLGARASLAFRATRQWLWVIAGMVAVAAFIAPDPTQAALQGAGKAIAGFAIYAALFGWHMVRTRDGAVSQAAAARTSWTRVAVYVTLAAAALTWIGLESRRSASTANERETGVFEAGQPNPFDALDQPTPDRSRRP